MSFWDELKKIQFRDIVPYIGAAGGYLVGGPAGAAAGYAIGGIASAKKPKLSDYQSTYEPSKWETDYYDYLKNIREGTSPLLNTENQYKLLKEKLQPEYKRLQKEYDIYSAQRGIQGGSQQAFKQEINEDQVERLMQYRKELEIKKQQLQLQAANSMGQLGAARSAAESQQAMQQFQMAMQQYNQLQSALSELAGMSGSLLYDRYNSPQSTDDWWQRNKQYYGYNEPLQTFRPQIGVTTRRSSPTYPMLPRPKGY